MKIICLLLCILSVTSAKVQPQTGANDVFDGVEGVIYDIPEYEDPEVSLFRLIAKGIMPVVIKGSPDSPNKDDKSHYQTDDIKKGLETVITQLQEARNKLENGNNAIYLDIDKAVLSLESLKHHLYFDLHSVIPTKQPGTSEIKTDGSSVKTPADRYSLVKASIKKYLLPDYPVYKSSSFAIPVQKALPSSKFTDVSFDDTALVPLPSKDSMKKSSAEQSFESVAVIDKKLSSTTEQPLPSEKSDFSYSDDKASFGPALSKEQNLPSSTIKPLNFSPSSEEPAVIDKSVYEFKFLGTTIPPVEVIPYGKEVKTGAIDEDTPAEYHQADQGDKALIRKKWTWKMSSGGPLEK